MKCLYFTTKVRDYCTTVGSEVCVETLSTVKQEVITLTKVNIDNDGGESCKSICFESVYAVVNLRDEIERLAEALSERCACAFHLSDIRRQH